jgi:hypothetical protein
LHHRSLHFGKLVITGEAPDKLTFEFPREHGGRAGSPSPVGLEREPTHEARFEAAPPISDEDFRSRDTR